MSEINEGVRIVVERMKTNPEEFLDGHLSKWAQTIHMANGARWLTEEERKLLDDAADQVQRERFTAEVLKTLTKTAEDYARDAYTDAYKLGQGRVAARNQLSGGNGAILTTTATATVPSAFGAIPKGEGQKVSY